MTPETENKPATFTAQQLDDWRAFEKVRKSGRFNMFDPNARKATKLSSEAYAFTMQNFSELKTAASK